MVTDQSTVPTDTRLERHPVSDLATGISIAETDNGVVITGLDQLPPAILELLQTIAEVWKFGFHEEPPAVIASATLNGDITATMQEGAHLTLTKGETTIELDREGSQELFDLLMEPDAQSALGW